MKQHKTHITNVDVEMIDKTMSYRDLAQLMNEHKVYFDSTDVSDKFCKKWLISDLGNHPLAYVIYADSCEVQIEYRE